MKPVFIISMMLVIGNNIFSQEDSIDIKKFEFHKHGMEYGFLSNTHNYLLVGYYTNLGGFKSGTNADILSGIDLNFNRFTLNNSIGINYSSNYFAALDLRIHNIIGKNINSNYLSFNIGFSLELIEIFAGYNLLLSAEPLKLVSPFSIMVKIRPKKIHVFTG